MKFNELDAGQKRRIVLTFLIYTLAGVIILAYFTVTLHSEKAHARDGWDEYLQDPPEQAQMAAERGADATEVTVGTYVENLREMNIKSSYYRVEFQVWFVWEGDEALNPAGHFRVYKGIENKRTVLAEVSEGGKHYQLVFMDVTVSKNFETRRFPLESHELRFYVESTYPIEQVVFVPDEANSGMNRNLSLSGYNLLRTDIGAVSYIYESSHGDPRLLEGEMNSELVTAIEINRANFGLYYKCFIALGGTITWALIALFICSYHHVDPLGMMPAALFGTVSNIMIGANLVPDALEMGLLEYVNLWGVLTILGALIAIININKVRKDTKNMEYAKFYGRMLFYTLLFFALVGQVVLPATAYIWA